MTLNRCNDFFHFGFAWYLGLTIAVYITFMRDLDTEGHATVYVTFAISAFIRPIAMMFCCFVRF